MLRVGFGSSKAKIRIHACCHAQFCRLLCAVAIADIFFANNLQVVAAQRHEIVQVMFHQHQT